MQTYKAYLTKEQWASVCELDDEIALEIAKQQPELAAEFGLGLESVIVRGSKGKKPKDEKKTDTPAKE